MRLPLRLAISLAVVFTASGCVAPVFNAPTTLSTRSVVERHARKLQPVTATSTSYAFVLIPVPADPRDLYDDLLAEAKRVGGNAVLDVQVRSHSTFLWLFPLVLVDTVEATGIAAVVQ
ncbi:MAG: hypothetical protein AB7O52_10120 [Planctomycetota bacterium]